MTLALSLDDKGACNACASSRREGQALSPFFDLDLRLSISFRWRLSAWKTSLRLLRRASRPSSPTMQMGTTSPERTLASGHSRTRSVMVACTVTKHHPQRGAGCIELYTVYAVSCIELYRAVHCIRCIRHNPAGTMRDRCIACIQRFHTLHDAFLYRTLYSAARENFVPVSYTHLRAHGDS